jgi:putative methionine-R-sulfoxide reductase with GAF domain
VSEGEAVAADEQDLADRLSDLARSLQSENDPASTLTRIVQAAVTAIPGVDDASISVVLGRRRVEAQAASGELPRRVDALQAETAQGPCLDAVYEEHTVRVPDMRSETRWPRFAARAAAAGAGSMLCFQLWVEGDNLGALNLYSRSPAAFDDESEHIGLLFASHAAVAFAGARQQASLHVALTTRDLIGQAKGVLMERHKITGGAAFELLVAASQDSNRKLRDVADELVSRGELTAMRARRVAPASYQPGTSSKL